MLFVERECGVWFCYRWVGDGERDIIVYLERGGEFFVWGGAEMILRRSIYSGGGAFNGSPVG